MKDKHSILLLALALAPNDSLSAVQDFVYENTFELQADGDFDGDGRRDLIVVDKTTGDYRIGYQLSTGVYTWVPARASGIANATALGVGKLNSLTYDSLALTGPDANRINILDATNTGTAGLPTSVFIPSLGPNLAAVIDIGGLGNTPLDDLYVASLDNGLNPFAETLVRNNGGTNQGIIADGPISYLRQRANAVLVDTNGPVRLALFERNVALGLDYFSLFDLSTGAALNLVSITTTNLPTPYDYVVGQFVSTNALTQVLLYPPGSYYFFEYQVIEPSPGVYSLAYSNSYSLADYFDRLFVLPGSDGTRLLALNTNDTAATVYSFDGLTAPVAIHQVTPPAGDHFTGAGPLGNGGFMAFSAPAGQNTSARFQQWTWNGTAYAKTTSGNLPRANAYSASGNVMQFQYEPFVTNNPILLRLNSAGDWSSGVVFSGSPAALSVQTETFLSSTQGLSSPTVQAFGPAHPLASFGLANQYSNNMSLFSFTPPAGDKVSDVTISPQPGLYSTSIQLQFTAANPTDKIFFRVGAGPWVAWSAALVVPVFTNTQVQYYGQSSSGLAKSAIKSASYSFTQGPATLDSKGDGIPDYVKIALGLPLTGSRDSDGDGYSDLEELIHGTNPLDPSSVPTNYPHLDDQAVFDSWVTPIPWDGFANAATLCATGAVLRAYDFQGSVLGFGSAGSNSWPVVPLTNILLVAEDRLVAQATDSHYAIQTTNSDTNIGREMIGLVPVPALPFPAVPYVYSGGNITNEALNWIAAASNTFNHLPRAVLTNSLTVNSTLESLLFELRVAQLLGARGYGWWSNVTLFPFRVADAGRTNPPQSLLLSLETNTPSQKGYLLQPLFSYLSNAVQTSASPGIVALRAVVQDIYRIDSLLNNTNPAKFALPVDEIRFFLWNGTVDTNYLPWVTTSGQFSNATAGAIAALAGDAPRPTTNVILVVRSDTTAGPCPILDLSGGSATFTLLDSTGQPFGFPNGFQLVPGSLVQVAGYTDVTSPTCPYPAIQVTSLVLTSIPIASGPDSNGNLLVDSWEEKFFGGLGIANPFADSDGDGYSNLQEMLEGSDPRDPYSRPTVPPVHFAPPSLVLHESGSQVELHFQWPAYYVNRFFYGVRHTSDLGLPFSDLAVPFPVNVSGDEFQITFPVPPGMLHFYYLTIALNY